MKQLFTSALFVAGLAATSSCSKDETTKKADNVSFSGEFTGANIAPTPVANTTGTGTVTGSFDKNSNQLTFTFTFAGLSGPVTLPHLHIGAPGTKGPSFYTASSLTSPITGTVILTQSQREALLAGNMYANIHTAKHQDLGEIRANLVVK